MFEVCANSVTCEFEKKQDAINGFTLAYGMEYPDFDIFELIRNIKFALEHYKVYEKGCLYVRDCK